MCAMAGVSWFVGRDAFVDTLFAGREAQMPVYLNKFKGTLTPAQMQLDLVFMPDRDNQPYRTCVVALW